MRDPRREPFGAAEEANLRVLALRVREHILGMATKGGCFIGASLSRW